MRAETLMFDQVHLGVPDPEAGARWYVESLGAKPGDHPDRVMFGKTRIIFLKNEAPNPSLGSAIDHFALSFADLGAAMKDIAKSGMKVTSPVSEEPGLGKVAFVEDPWGARIQLVEDRETVGFHHVHLQLPDPVLATTWYLERFGGAPGRYKGRLHGIDYGGVWLFIERGAGVPSPGHTIDHIGWRMPDLLAKVAELKAKGLRFATEPKPGPPGPQAPAWMSFTDDPWGVKIELLQRRGE
ncbi:MAG: hypothetical protein EXR91_01825 [Gemmatimonadetes bacterium]|nr:hypothetical protein [Gemmatimonadota bacterium]